MSGPSVVELRFYGAQNDFLAPRSRGRLVRRAVNGSPAVKDVIEAAGVPHVEVAAIVADGLPVTFAHRVRAGERIGVFAEVPIGLRETVPPSAAGDLPARRGLRFVADGHLGRLAAYLRMLGFDTAYSRDASDAELADLAASEERILLSRDLGLLKRSIVRRGYFPRSDDPHEQLREVVRRFDLAPACHPFGRCLSCNGLLESVEPALVRPFVPPRVAREQAEFRRCPHCRAIFWRGSHHARMVRLIERLVPGATGAPPSP
ncbi:MAG: Mut7-C RNAse domain-containing protein [Candidatus Limnocylindrales bacterium]